ncbi:MAG: hypothetical protein PUP91_10935 [Rhizonema sp. PD37]|nr:hypothetical protein [Rhizonema sp. PD37]
MKNFDLSNLQHGQEEVGTQEDTVILSVSTFPDPGVSRAESLPSTESSSTLLLLYLIPVIGFFPSLWTLYRRQGSREQLTLSRLSITLTVTWLFGYIFLATGTLTTSSFPLRLLILNSFLTSSYFLVSIWLIVSTARGKTRRLPGLSRFAERVLSKYLS